MTLLFIHDHPFYKEKEIIYSGGGLPNLVWNNYLHYFEKVIVFGRKSFNEKDKKVESSSNNVSFELTENYSELKDVLLKYSKVKNELENIIKNADIVLVRLPSIYGFIGANIAFKSGKKVIVEQVGNAGEAMRTHGSTVGKIAAPFLEKINKHIVKKANYVSYVTINKLQNDYPSKALTASISDVIINKVKASSEIDFTKFENQIVRIGIIGGFDTRYKGQDVVLKAVSILDQSIRNNIELYFVGKGDANWLVEKSSQLGLKENIKFLGSKESGKEIFNFLDTLSIYIQPSYTEGMPRALLEAMSMGCPVLGSTVGGIPDVVVPKHLHKPGDFKEISYQIETFINDRSLMKSEALRSLEVVKPFQKNLLDKKRKEFYDQIVNDLQNA